MERSVLMIFEPVLQNFFFFFFFYLTSDQADKKHLNQNFKMLFGTNVLLKSNDSALIKSNDSASNWFPAPSWLGRLYQDKTYKHQTLFS